jgi:phosphoribosylaminoimidazole-succinocarboxamide synthase
LTGLSVSDVIADPSLAELLEQRSVVVKRLEPIPVEAIVRGYLIGSGWTDYQATGAVCGIPLPPGLQQADKLPEVIFTPSTKATAGDHDINVDFETIVNAIGADLANQIRDASIRIYEFAADYALQRGIIIADTKFEFGLDAAGKLYLMDEVLTPDSSRFWPLDSWQPGSSPPSYDKQFVRDYLETLDWNKQAPGPLLPADIIEASVKKYEEACRILTENT